MSKDLKAYYVLRRFKGVDGPVARGTLEHDGGSHVAYWHAYEADLPPTGKYQMLMHEGHFSLRDSTCEIHAVGNGKGVQIGRVMGNDGVSLHGDWLVDYLQGMHRSRDAEGVGSWLEVR